MFEVLASVFRLWIYSMQLPLVDKIVHALHYRQRIEAIVGHATLTDTEKQQLKWHWVRPVVVW